MPDALTSCADALRDCHTALEATQNEGLVAGFLLGVGTVVVLVIVVESIWTWQQRKGRG